MSELGAHPGPRGPYPFGPRAVAVMLCGISGYGVFATLVRNVELAAPGYEHLPYVVGMVGVLLIASAIYRLRERLERFAGRITAFADRTSGVRWFSGCLVTGVTARIVWNVWYPPVQRSDMATYMDLADSLVRDGVYVTAGSYAYWPPGLPLSLVPTLTVFRDHPSWVPLLNNLVWFGVALAAAYWLGGLLVDGGLGRIAALLVTLWPNLVLLSGLAAKELVLVALVPLAMGAYLKAAIVGRSATMWAGLAGAVVGYAALTQPSLLLLPVVFILHELMRREEWSRSARRLTALLVGMILVLAPWTIRNYLVLDAFVLVSTAGGNSLYQANNPLATGGYVPGLSDDLEQYDELTAARLARQRALKWIVENPWRVTSLALRKQILLLGDDGSGAYGTLKRGLEVAGIPYAMFKGISNGYWIFLLTLVALGVLRRWPGRLLDRPAIALLMLPLLYAFAIHSVFESDGRHHVAATVPLALIAGLAFGRADGDSAAVRPGRRSK